MYVTHLETNYYFTQFLTRYRNFNQYLTEKIKIKNDSKRKNCNLKEIDNPPYLCNCPFFEI